MSGKHDHESREDWYRRGYIHGAWHLYRALESCLPEDAREIARSWITEDLYDWRSAGQKANAETIEGEIADATPAPRTRLGQLRKSN
jgi:hypothetical protein